MRYSLRILLLVASFSAPTLAAPPGESSPPNVEPQPSRYEDRDRLGWAAPDYVRLQTGGFLGMFTIGVGYSALRDVLNIGVSYGFVPPYHGAPAVHVGTATLQIRPLRFPIDQERIWIYPLYVGGGLFVAHGKNLFVQQPNVYPPGYYEPTALHYLLLFGAEAALRQPSDRFFTRHSAFIEFVTVDQYIDALQQNREFRLYDAFSTTLGYRASF